MKLKSRIQIGGLFFLTLLLINLTGSLTHAHKVDDIKRIAIVSAFSPEMKLLSSELENPAKHSINGVTFLAGTLEDKEVVMFLSGISVVNAAMTVQLALTQFNVQQIIYSGIAGGVDPDINIGDVVIADRWGNYLESVFAREIGDDWQVPPFFEYPYANYGMMFPRSVDVQRAGSDELEVKFWFDMDKRLLQTARTIAAEVELNPCTQDNTCLEQTPRIIVGGSGVSGGSFIDNAEFRTYIFATFGASVLDMESAAVAHVAYANEIPYIAVRSVSDLAGGGEGENQIGIFLGLAADNAAAVVKALLKSLP